MTIANAGKTTSENSTREITLSPAQNPELLEFYSAGGKSSEYLTGQSDVSMDEGKAINGKPCDAAPSLDGETFASVESELGKSPEKKKKWKPVRGTIKEGDKLRPPAQVHDQRRYSTDKRDRQSANRNKLDPAEQTLSLLAETPRAS